MESKIEFSLVLPIHNQADIIEGAVLPLDKVLRDMGVSYEIVAVENGSTDGTIDVLKKLAKTNKKLKIYVSPKGYGNAVIAGLKKAQGRVVCYMPSDGQLDPELVSKLYGEFKRGNYDLVKIKRVTRESYFRFIQSKVFNLLTSLLYRLPKNLTDINGSPRVFERRLLTDLDLTYKDSFVDTEFAAKAYFLKLRVREIPAETLPRLGGKSTVSYKTVIEFLNNLFYFKGSKEFESWRKRQWRR